MIISGKANLSEAVIPQLGGFVRNKLYNSGSYCATLPICCIPMHPLQWQCDRLFTQMNSYVRWKVLRLAVEFVPSKGTNVEGTILMGFTSCISDGGPQGAMTSLKTAISDLPGSEDVPIGTPGRKCHMTFVDAFDWNFTCLKGGTINEVYAGAFVAAVSGNRDFILGIDSAMYLGDFIIHYEIALAEPAAVLQLSRSPVVGKWNYAQNANIVQGSLISLALDDTVTSTDTGDILQLTWFDPIVNYDQFAVPLENYCRFTDSPTAPSAISIGNRPKDGQTVYGRVRTGVNGDLMMRTVDLYESIDDAKNMHRKLVACATPASSSSSKPYDWANSILRTAKVLIPQVVRLAEMML